MGAARHLHGLLTGDDDLASCPDIPEEACREQPGNFARHLASLTATKTGDGLADPKLVLSWLLATLGAPAAALGLLVPVREAGALLPQLAIAARIRRLPRRKGVWAAGSAVQGIAVAGMAVAALSLRGAALGWTVVGLLAVFALARSACSVSYKDVLGKTVARSTRGTATGTASALASLLVLAFGVLLSTGTLPATPATIAGALGLAALLWVGAALLFATLAEAPGATETGDATWRDALSQLARLRDDAPLRRFVVTRGLLLATALAPPYVLAAAGRQDGGLGTLGPFVIASALASASSGIVWGRLADRSSRRVLIAAAVAAALVLGAMGALVLADASGLGGGLVLAGLFFLLMVAYQGVRTGRSTHVVDMADEDTRATYTAVSNTTIGVLLVLGGAAGPLAGWIGVGGVLLAFAGSAALAALAALRLDEVQTR